MKSLLHKMKNIFKLRPGENRAGKIDNVGSELFGGAASDLARSINETEKGQLRKKFWRIFFHL